MREPFLPEAVEFTTRLPADLNDRLAQVARARYMSKNAAVLAAVSEYLCAAGDGDDEGSV